MLQFRDRDVACCYGLSVSQCYALKAIVDQGAMTVNDLARHLFMDKSTASRVADALLRMGHITRTTDPRDRRAVRLAPTASGRKVCRRIVEELDAECADLLEAYSPEVADALIHLLGRLTRNVSGRASGAGCCVRATPGT
ncbi:MAG: MarR family winged helix-turn-helix transcriptional regulator [Gemmatimonadota bacterium]